MEFFPFESREELASSLAKVISTILKESINKKGWASLVVSGGRSPISFFKILSEIELPWQYVWITLADERWVSQDSEDSNEHLVRKYLLKGPASRAKFIGLKNSAISKEDAEKLCHKVLAKFSRPFDVVVLGMGTDGHCASFFPGAKELAQAVNEKSKKSCVMIRPLNAKHLRMTLTLSRLLDARNLFLYIVGHEKYKILKKALEKGKSNEMPIRYFLKQKETPLKIYYSP